MRKAKLAAQERLNRKGTLPKPKPVDPEKRAKRRLAQAKRALLTHDFDTMNTEAGRHQYKANLGRVTRLGYAALLLLALLALPAVADDARRFHWPRPVPTPTPAPTPACAPGLAPGTICIWPSTAVSIPLAALGQPDLPAIGRIVAIIEGPLLVPMDPRAIRVSQSWSLSESWFICETQEPAGSFGVSLSADAWCPPAP